MDAANGDRPGWLIAVEGTRMVEILRELGRPDHVVGSVAELQVTG